MQAGQAPAGMDSEGMAPVRRAPVGTASVDMASVGTEQGQTLVLEVGRNQAGHRLLMLHTEELLDPGYSLAEAFQTHRFWVAHRCCCEEDCSPRL